MFGLFSGYVKRGSILTCTKSAVPGFAPSEGALVQTIFVKELIKYPSETPPPSEPVEVQLAKTGTVITTPIPGTGVPGTLIPPEAPKVVVPPTTVAKQETIKPQALPSASITTPIPGILIPPEAQKVEEAPKPLVAGFPSWGILLIAGVAFAFIFRKKKESPPLEVKNQKVKKRRK
jgi:hypothetical protein